MTTAQAYGTCLTPVLRTPTCWHLPTKAELELLYEQQYVVGGFSDNSYWSSTANNSGYAWYQLFINGIQSNYGNDGASKVRVVRAF